MIPRLHTPQQRCRLLDGFNVMLGGGRIALFVQAATPLRKVSVDERAGRVPTETDATDPEVQPRSAECYGPETSSRTRRNCVSAWKSYVNSAPASWVMPG